MVRQSEMYDVTLALIPRLTEQAMQYRPKVVLDERVTGLRVRGERVIELSTPKGRHFTQTAVIAVGCGAFVPRTLYIPHLIDLEGHGIYYYLPSSEPLRGKKVLVVGGGTAAAAWALRPSGLAG